MELADVIEEDGDDDDDDGDGEAEGMVGSIGW